MDSSPLRVDSPISDANVVIGAPTRGFMSGHVANIDMPCYQTPKLYIANVSTKESEGSGSRTSIILRVSQDSLFEGWLNNLDQFVFSEAASKWKEWFPSADEPVRDDFCSSIYTDEDGNQCFRFYPGTTKTNQTLFFDESGSPMDQKIALDHLGQNFVKARIALVITCCGIWMSNKRFGPRFKIHQVKVY